MITRSASTGTARPVSIDRAVRSALTSFNELRDMDHRRDLDMELPQAESTSTKEKKNRPSDSTSIMVDCFLLLVNF